MFGLLYVASVAATSKLKRYFPWSQRLEDEVRLPDPMWLVWDSGLIREMRPMFMTIHEDFGDVFGLNTGDPKYIT